MFIYHFLENVWGNPENFDFKASLDHFIQTKEYDPYADVEALKKEFSESLKDHRPEKALSLGMKILEIKPFDIEIHALLSQIYFRKNDPKKSHLHNYIASSLLDRILKSGDGKSYLTAYKIYNPEDEMAVFCYMKKYPVQRVNHEKYDRFIDVYSFEDGQTLFFDITLLFKHVSGEKEDPAEKKPESL